MQRGEPVWVTPMVMRPGKQSLFIHHQQSQGIHRVAVQTCIINVRQERVPHFQKQEKAKEVKIEVFSKDGSVFAQWRDNNRLFEQHDFSKWKIDRFVKKSQEMTEIKQFFLDNIQHIKEIYANMQAESILYPGVSALAFSEFCQAANLIDKTFSLSTADRLFIAANYDVSEDAGDNSQNELIRYELLEILARMAKAKYLDHGACTSVVEGLRFLLDHILGESPMVRWASWRENKLWTTEMNNLFHNNIDPLKKSFFHIARKPKAKRIRMADMIQYFVLCREPEYDGIRVAERYFRTCYALCKMPVQNEEHEMEQYKAIVFVEYLEFLGRLAEFKFKDQPSIQEEPLVTRCEYLLDALFFLVGEERRDTFAVLADESASDDDY